MAAADEREKSTIREYWEALLIAFVFVNFAKVFIFQAFKIPSGSMEDNLKVGDHIVVNKFIYGPKGDGVLSKLLHVELAQMEHALRRRALSCRQLMWRPFSHTISSFAGIGQGARAGRKYRPPGARRVSIASAEPRR